MHWLPFLIPELTKRIRDTQLALPDLIIPVPLHKKRLRERGFNQALMLAKPLAKQLKTQCSYSHCIRSRYTIPQADLPASRRKSNVKNAFEIKKDVRGKHIALLDDVVTTGNTATEITRSLLAAGAQRVDVWCLSKT